jgi:hypothetical protein
MKGLFNGVVRELTQEEETNLREMCDKENAKVTESQRISALENAIADLAMMLAGGANNV